MSKLHLLNDTEFDPKRVLMMWDFLVRYFRHEHNHRQLCVRYRDELKELGILTPYEIADGL